MMTGFSATLGMTERILVMTYARTAKFGLGQKVRHVHDAFFGLVVDVDASYYGPIEDIDGVDPSQPFYSIMIEQGGRTAIAYTAEEALIGESGDHLSRQEQLRLFNVDADGHHAPRVHALQ